MNGNMQSQPTVYLSPHTTNSLFYWITLRKSSLGDLNSIKKACAMIEHTAKRINNPTGLVVGVGFGESFARKVGFEKSFQYVEWIGNTKEIVLPKTDGDIFVHAKGLDVGSLFEFQQLFEDSLPTGVIDERKTYIFRGFLYQHHRDISGFIDGIVNPLTTQDQHLAAVDPADGGSFVITQRWVHNMDIIKHANDADRNGWIGRTRSDAKLLDPLPQTSHVALMKRGGQMVRQAMPIVEDNQPGLFFIAYAKSTGTFDDHLQNMTEGNGDQLFIMSRNTMGAYWYFPGLDELRNLAN